MKFVADNKAPASNLRGGSRKFTQKLVTAYMSSGHMGSRASIQYCR